MEGKGRLEREQLTRFLNEWVRGGPTAAEHLMPHIHSELHAIASSYVRSQRADHTWG